MFVRRGRRTIAVAVPAVIFLAKSLGAVAACYCWVRVLVNETGLQNMWNGEVIGMRQYIIFRKSEQLWSGWRMSAHRVVRRHT